MVLEAITYILQALTYFTVILTDWEVSEGVSIGSIIVWYLSVLVIIWTIGHIITGSHNGGDSKTGGDKHD